MRLICKICHKVYGFKFPSTDRREVKGICPECEKESTKEPTKRPRGIRKRPSH